VLALAESLAGAGGMLVGHGSRTAIPASRPP
jgi:hypothetical protein